MVVVVVVRRDASMRYDGLTPLTSLDKENTMSVNASSKAVLPLFVFVAPHTGIQQVNDADLAPLSYSYEGCAVALPISPASLCDIPVRHLAHPCTTRLLSPFIIQYKYGLHAAPTRSSGRDRRDSGFIIIIIVFEAKSME
jgi:hypothetical protein